MENEKKWNGKWLMFAMLSALFSALATTLSKVGLEGINSNFATAIRTTVALVLAWGIVGASKAGKKNDMTVTKSQLIFLVLSAIGTGVSWLFYNRALQLGATTKVAAIDKMSVALVAIISVIFLREAMNWKTVLSVALILGGTAMLMFA